MNLEKERELFEAWCTRDDNYCIHRYAGDDKYSEWDTQAAWDAWLASASREGYKLVLAEPSKEKIKDMQKIWWNSDCCHTMKTGTAKDLYKAMIGACDD